MNFVYLSNSMFGGWVNFAAHLLKKKNSKLIFKVGKRLEQKGRVFGYDLAYQNVPLEFLQTVPCLILAVDKQHRHYLDKLINNQIVIHDPTEIKPELIEHLKNYKVITIRKMVQDYLKTNFNIKSEFKFHPFFQYKRSKSAIKKEFIATSRIDFDKNTDIILKANKLLKQKIKVYGFVNRIYAFHKLKDLGFEKYYKGQYDKTFKAISDLHSTAKFMIDLSTIKNDGGGTQYTFLEAIYEGTALILNRKWLTKNGDFKEGFNCYAVDDEKELASLLSIKLDTEKIINNAKKLLKRHIESNW